MTSRILQEDDGLILTEADEPIVNNLDVGASRILQQDDGLILTTITLETSYPTILLLLPL